METSRTPESGREPEPTEPAYELKFALNESDVEPIALILRRLLPPDPNAPTENGGLYRVESLYFDTAALDVFHRTSGFSETKYRVRRYTANGVVFFEEKRKVRGLVRKRRTRAAVSEIASLDARDASSSSSGASGVEWFRERVRTGALSPQCQIAYERLARVGECDGVPIRVTLDRAIRCAAARGEARFLDLDAAFALAIDRYILEMKFPGALPVVLKDLIVARSLRPSAISKYRLAIERCGIAGAGEHD
jgi:hypothetical protein